METDEEFTITLELNGIKKGSKARITMSDQNTDEHITKILQEHIAHQLLEIRRVQAWRSTRETPSNGNG